ncbi:MAG TPA: saccharopine dehydrogenase NADP-binding domain-containing protein [Baekduia sp.]|nr:saccharopine dehydrogenase NADP-binding domain-containing protein [Baekduia sp.]
MPRIVLFGATGYTGDLVARALAARGAQPVLAARSESRVRALARELGAEHAVADVAQPETVRALVERGDVLVSTVGPFVRFGQAAVQAAVATGAHYLDSTGEPPFIREVFERHGPGAQAAGCGLVTAFGADWVPGNLAGALALREAPEATALHLGYYAQGMKPSGGTAASLTGVILEPGYTFRDGRLVTERGARRLRRFEVGGRSRPAISVAASEHFGLPRLSPALRDVDVYLGWFGPASRAMQLSGGLGGAAMRVAPVRRAFEAVTQRVVKGSTGGPDAAQRARVRTVVVAQARSPAGDVLATVRLEGVDPYDFTGRVLAWGAERALAGGLLGTGALGPVDGFGVDALEAGVRESGISRV